MKPFCINQLKKSFGECSFRTFNEHLICSPFMARTCTCYMTNPSKYRLPSASITKILSFPNYSHRVYTRSRRLYTPHPVSCSAPATRTAIVCRVYTRTQKLHYTPSLLTVHPARKQPPCCSAQCLPNVHMSWAWLKWARPAERHLTASAGTSGAQFCLLSPPIWPCFSLLEQSTQCRWEEGANKSRGMDEGEVRQ